MKCRTSANATRSPALRWSKRDAHHWVREDGAVVKLDRDSVKHMRRPWEEVERSWIGFGPGGAECNVLQCRPRKLRKGGIASTAPPRRFKSAASAMRAVDRYRPPVQERIEVLTLTS